MDVLKHFRTALNSMHILSLGERIVIGVSGGADSMALLHLFMQLRSEMDLILHVVHVHHGIRGEEADEDAAFVEQVAQTWAVPCTIRRIDVPSLARDHKHTIEEAARNARYKALAEIAASIGASLISVGHNADDQAETVLMHLLRGSGLAGLRGILPVMSLDNQFTVIRPLLNVPHHALETYCAAHNITPRQDSTNTDPAYFRNRLRHQVMPVLNDLVPGLRDRLVQSAELLRADHQVVWLRVLQGWNETVLEQTQERVRFKRTAWHTQPLGVQRELIRWAVRRMRGTLHDLGFDHVEAGIRLIQNGETGTQINLPDGVIIRVGYEDIVIAEADEVIPLPNHPLLVSNQVITVTQPDMYYPVSEGWRFIWSSYDGPRDGPEWNILLADPFSAILSNDALPQATDLLLRTRRPGDRFYPQGAGGSQSLKKFMNAAKISAPWRDRLPLLTHGDAIIWVCGYRIDERFTVRSATRRVWLARFEKTA